MNLIERLLEEFGIHATLAYARARTARNYIGPVLFPQNDVLELTFEYWKTANQAPVMANFQAFGAEAEIASREGAEKIRGEIPPIKRKINLDERYLLALRKEGLGDFDLVSNQLFNDLDRMVDSFWARAEKTRMDAIAYGQIALAENGVKMTVDYGVDADTQQETLLSTAKWNDYDDSTPLDDMQGWADQVVDNCGVRPTRVITSGTIVSHLCKNEQIRQAIWGTTVGTAMPVNINSMNTLLASMDLPTIVSYDLLAREQAANGAYSSVRLFPQDKFVMLPPDTLGESLVGPTGESLLNQKIDVTELAGLFASVVFEDEPPAVWTKVAGTFIPTFPLVDCIFQATVI